MKQRTTTHSEYGRIQSVLIKRASDAFIREELIESQWKDLNFIEAPALEGAIKQYQDFERLLHTFQPRIYCLPKSDAVTIDSIYCRDASIVTDQGLILCSMGKVQRMTEPEAVKQFCLSNGIPVLGSIEEPGTLEGGDVAWIDEQTLAVGHTYRTNKEGIRQLEIMLKPLDIDVVVVQLPHYRGPGDVFHLMSVFSPIDRDLAVVYSPLMPVAFRELLLARYFHLIEVPDHEFESMGCNVLALAPRQVVVVSGNPVTRSLMEKAGCMVYEYEGSEISVKGGGGPTCLTRPLSRSMLDTGFG